MMIETSFFFQYYGNIVFFTLLIVGIVQIALILCERTEAVIFLLKIGKNSNIQ